MEYNSERLHEPMNNLAQEEYQLMTENAEISKKVNGPFKRDPYICYS
jgi:hypothetical protein